MNYFKTTFCFILLALNMHAHAQDLHFYRYSMGISYQYLNVEHQATDYYESRSTNGHAIGIYYKGTPYQYLQMAAGLDYMFIDDNAPFKQTVKNRITGEVTERTSDITGLGAYFELGFKYTLAPKSPFTLGMLGGYRYNDIERTVALCDKCDEQALTQFDNSVYAKAFIEYQITDKIDVQLSYTNYFKEDGLSDSIGVSMSFMSF